LDERIINDGAHIGLVVRKIPLIRGVGVFCRRSFMAGEVVVRYMGTTISLEEAERRNTQREQDERGNSTHVFVKCHRL